MSLSFYDPDQITILAAGVKVSGYADGEFVTVANVTDAFSDVVGTDGDVARARSNDRRCDITIKLMQTSPTNDVFSAIHRADLNGVNGSGVFPIQIQDLQGTTIVHGSAAWIVKAPDASFDRSPKSREWKIRVARVERFDGGNIVA